MNIGNENIRALARREMLRKWGRRLACLAVLIALGVGAVRFYQAQRKKRLARQTTALLAAGDFKSAVLVARRLLQLDENNLAGCQAMAEMAEKVGRAEAITWRKKIAHIRPEDPENQLALARTALRFGQPEMAETVLQTLPQRARHSVEYHQVAGADALARRDIARADQHFAEAARLSPDNAHVAVTLACLRLTSRDSARAAEARTQLEQLSDKPGVRGETLRALAADALARQDTGKALAWTTQLMAEKGATFSDSLLHFQAVRGTDAAEPTLEELKTKAAQSPQTASELITWLNRQGLARAALHWSSSLPQTMTDIYPLPLAIAESYSFLQEWPALNDFVEGKNWREMEPLRLAVQSHALHRLSPPERPSMEAQTVWRAALQAAHAHLEQLIAIAQLAEGWGYETEAAEAWWDVANHGEHTRQALSALQRLYMAKQDTRGLLRVAKRALELNPNDLVAANNCASLGLLLHADTTSRRLASRLHNEHPTNRAFAATYAFALHTEGKFADGLKLMESMKEEDLRHPTLAAYYVVMLVENGHLERARAFLVDAKRASLLPEEQQLLDFAVRKLGV